MSNRGFYPDTFHALCPYFAMFPPSFAHKAIKKFSNPGDLILDPFSGRGTTLLEARLMGRRAIGNDINPVAYFITKAKSNKLNLKECLEKVEDLRNKYKKVDKNKLEIIANKLPEFFQYAFAHPTLLQILWLKKTLKNVDDPTLIFIKTLCLSYLHGETGKVKQVYFSNNLPHTYCPKPGYSISFWKKRNMKAPNVDVFDILTDRTLFRLQNSKQVEAKYDGVSILGDVRDLDYNFSKVTKEKVDLIVTSPPYIAITSYESDQWLRLWFLGGQPYPETGVITKDDLISSEKKYTQFLTETWSVIGKIMKKTGKIVCRIGQSSQDSYPIRKMMSESLKKSGHNFKIIKIEFSSFKKIRQSLMFNKKVSKKSGEYDFIIEFIS